MLHIFPLILLEVVALRRGGGEKTSKNNNCTITSKELAFFSSALRSQNRLGLKRPLRSRCSILKMFIQLPARKAMGPNCHGLLIYYIFLLTIWLLSVLLPLRENVIYNQFQQIPYAWRLENKWYFNITHCRRASSSPDPSSCSVCGVLVFLVCFFSRLSAAQQLGFLPGSTCSAA